MEQRKHYELIQIKANQIVHHFYTYRSAADVSSDNWLNNLTDFCSLGYFHTGKSCMRYGLYMWSERGSDRLQVDLQNRSIWEAVRLRSRSWTTEEESEGPVYERVAGLQRSCCRRTLSVAFSRRAMMTQTTNLDTYFAILCMITSRLFKIQRVYIGKFEYQKRSSVR